MVRQNVESSNIKSVGYDPEKLILEVEFHTKKVYQYLGVKQDVYNDLLASDSIGSYFARNIKGHYDSSLIAAGS